MEIKSEKGQIILLDACTLINILYIDEDEFIIKLLKKLNFFIVEKVYEETKKNLLARLTPAQKDINNLKFKLSNNLKHLSHNIIWNSDVQDLVGSNFINDSLEIFNYRKWNGEFYSCSYSLFLSRFYDTKIIFYTDDYPAQQHFTKFFEFQKIGYIEDVFDLLVFLSALKNNFTTKMLEDYFSSILVSYNAQIVNFKKELEKYRSELNIHQKKDRFLRENLTSLIKKLTDFDLEEIYFYQNKFSNRKYSTLNKIIKAYSSVFDINSKSREKMIKKSKNTINLLKKQKLYKI